MLGRFVCSRLIVVLATVLLVACTDDEVTAPDGLSEVLAAQGRSTTAIGLTLAPSIDISTSPAGTRADGDEDFAFGVFVVSRLQYDALCEGDEAWRQRADYIPYYNVRVRMVGGECVSDTTLYFPLGSTGDDELSSGVHIFAYAPYRRDLTLRQLIDGIPVQVAHDQTGDSFISDDFLFGEATATRANDAANGAPYTKQAVELQLRHKLALLNIAVRMPITSVYSQGYSDVQQIRLSVGNCYSAGYYSAIADTFAIDSTLSTLLVLDDRDSEKLHRDIMAAYNRLPVGSIVIRRAAALTLPSDSIPNLPFVVELICSDSTVTITRNTLDALPSLNTGSSTFVNITLDERLSNSEGAVVQTH